MILPESEQLDQRLRELNSGVQLILRFNAFNGLSGADYYIPLGTSTST